MFNSEILLIMKQSRTTYVKEKYFSPSIDLLDLELESGFCGSNEGVGEEEGEGGFN